MMIWWWWCCAVLCFSKNTKHKTKRQRKRRRQSEKSKLYFVCSNVKQKEWNRHSTENHNTFEIPIQIASQYTKYGTENAELRQFFLRLRLRHSSTIFSGYFLFLFSHFRCGTILSFTLSLAHCHLGCHCACVCVCVCGSSVFCSFPICMCKAFRYAFHLLFCVRLKLTKMQSNWMERKKEAAEAASRQRYGPIERRRMSKRKDDKNHSTRCIFDTVDYRYRPGAIMQ